MLLILSPQRAGESLLAYDVDCDSVVNGSGAIIA